jgi:hypothetical protein
MTLLQKLPGAADCTQSPYQFGNLGIIAKMLAIVDYIIVTRPIQKTMTLSQGCLDLQLHVVPKSLAQTSAGYYRTVLYEYACSL